MDAVASSSWPGSENWLGATVRPGFLPGITTVILTFNEDMHIARAIENAWTFSREILVVDSFSTDRTVEIATAMGARVVQNGWINYAKQFLFALNDCGIATEWVLRLDADELIGPELVEQFNRDVPGLSEDVTGVILNRRHIFMDRWVRHGGRYPLYLLRLWRNGLGEVEDRWMDEHVFIKEGRTISMKGAFSDASVRDIAFFVTKHNGYAAREALDVLGKKYGLFTSAIAAENSGKQASMKRFIKEKIYNRLPFGTGSLGYFLYRYFIQLGFLDGRSGFIYHFMQGFWYRFLVEVRVLEFEKAIATCTTNEQRIEALRQATGLKI